MQNKNFYCTTCVHSFERTVLETVVLAACPMCGRLAKLVEVGMNLGLNFGQAVFIVAAGFLAYKLLSD